ncbi:unnamed protein product [Protopolystoma xenopodis]|uniref:Uncharacterized protein n=1 Tax=Protopolystoma xenopodis TaxID=117903 RepID=A0A3S5BLR4_9PLAT|nr:unnamed protein product [Protopolystoma xenopodis]
MAIRVYHSARHDRPCSHLFHWEFGVRIVLPAMHNTIRPSFWWPRETAKWRPQAGLPKETREAGLMASSIGCLRSVARIVSLEGE